jgi:hypothetical protein
MPMRTYQPLPANPKQFVEFWSLRYEYAIENLYIDNIRQELTGPRILNLFHWKNGTRLSKRKETSVNHNFIQRKNELAQLQPNESAEDFAKDFLDRFNNGGAIWRIFWLHCWKPDRFPIYDQHVHRAMVFIKTGAREDISQDDPQKIKAYIHSYLPFYNDNFADFDKRERAVDKALWAFGKFIKISNFPLGGTE